MPADALSSALLPAGLHDVLPSEAAHEAAAVERLLAEFAATGYRRVDPPLVAFEENLSDRLLEPVYPPAHRRRVHREIDSGARDESALRHR